MIVPLHVSRLLSLDRKLNSFFSLHTHKNENKNENSLKNEVFCNIIGLVG